MNGTEVAGGVSLRDLFAGIDIQGDKEVPDITVSEISASSNTVVSGGLFIACRGYARHGLEFLDEALTAQPAGVAWEPDEQFDTPEFPAGVADICVPGLADQVGLLADRFFASPSAELAVTGITGTNGKTTTAWLVARALGHLGETAGYMGTAGYGIGADIQPSSLTTPGCIAVHRRLRVLADAGAVAVIMEVSSHGLDQGRIDGVRLHTAAFTNLSRDHLDYHGDMAAYEQAKTRLFEIAGLRSAVINVGDAFGAELAERFRGQVDLLTVAMQGAEPAGRSAALTAVLHESRGDGLRIGFAGEFGTAELESPLWGAFNVENLLVATGILLARGYSLSDAVGALRNCEAPPGRMQLIRGSAKAPLVVVDFAHTPAALQTVLAALREHCAGQVSVVFGCGGNRDQGKRAAMGSIAAQGADRIIVTDDNPRDEDPAEIAADIVAGVTGNPNLEVLHDRAVAIETAIRSAGPGDAVLIAGKGSESIQLIAGEQQPFSDAAVAANVLEAAA